MNTAREPEARQPGPDSFRLLVESVTDYALFTTDPGDRVSAWNPGAERLFGYPAAEALGGPLARLFTPEDVARGEPDRETAGALSDGRAEGERWYVRKDGSRFFASGVVTPMRDESGQLLGFARVLRDLTERRRMEEELAASESRSRCIAEQSPVLIWRSDTKGRRDYLNRRWYDFTGRTPGEELAGGSGWVQGVHPDDLPGYLEAARVALLGRQPFEANFRLRRHDGQYRWVVDRGVPYFDPRGQFLGFLGSCLDFTERVELEQALQDQRELAEEAARHKTRLMSALSHDARTPLNAVVLAAHLLEMHLGDRNDPEVGPILETIRHSVKNVLDLLNDLLNLVKIDAGAAPAEVTRFALGGALAECLSGIEGPARQRGLDVRLEPGALAGATLETDRAKLKQVLNNLLSNALRYTERGTIRLLAASDEDQLTIAVEDTGVGIAAADQARVFEEFARLDNPHRPSGEGTGLGLAISRRLASLLGGEIRLQSEPGRGSTFTLVLPASVLSADAPAIPDPPASAVPTRPSPSTGSILIVEDHLNSRQTLARVLRRMGYKVLEAGNGRDALGVARRERPLAVLMDVNMPVMDGIEATRAFRSDPGLCDLPIFALTGDVSVMNQRRIGEAGVDGCLEKPVNWDALRQALAGLTDPSPPV